MTRVNKGLKTKKRRKNILKMAKGYYGARNRLFKSAKEAVEKSLCYAYRDRKTKKRIFRRLWILHINAACRTYNIRYSQLIQHLATKKIKLNRKILSEIAIKDPNGFKEILKK